MILVRLFLMSIFLCFCNVSAHRLSMLKSMNYSQVRTRHGTTVWFKIGKGVHQGCILSPCLFNLYAEYMMRNTGLDEAQARIKIAGRNINNLRYADDTTLMAEKWRGAKEPLDEGGKRKEWRSWLKTQYSKEDHGIQPHHLMANRQRNNGTSDRLYFLGLQNYCGC